MKKLLSSLLIALTVMIAVIPARASLPAGYTELEYIESTGTQWIDTGVIPNANYSIETKAIKHAGHSLLGAQGFNLTGGGGREYWYLSGHQIVYPTLDLSVVHVWGYNAQARQIYCDNITVQAIPGGGTISGNIFLFSRGVNNDAGSHKMYYVKIWDSNESLVRNMIPAKRNSDNVVGMYDLVSGQFFTNAGTGTFTAGPAKCRNLFDGQWRVGIYSTTTGAYSPSVSNRVCNVNMIQVEPSTTYTVSCPGCKAMRWLFYDANKNFISAIINGVATITTPSNARYINFYIANDLTVATAPDLQLEQGSTATTYVPYCAPEIKIATTAYNTARFNPVKTDLDSAVATIRDIVTKTINQTAAIASLQADKQTRPEDACPAGKKCLLVETEENGVIVPHWFPIIEAPEDN